MREPLLSIVIANYNYGRFLEAAIRSVLDQSCPEVELIVCDGGSKDESRAIIEKYRDRLAWWCSEPDRGQSDAFNKGFAHAKGTFLTWLNADDIIPQGALERVCAEMKAHPQCKWFTGNFFRFRNDNGAITEIGWGPNCYPTLLQRRSSPPVVFGPTSFFAKELCERLGGFDVSFHYTMDTDMWLRMICAGAKQRRVRCFCWGFRIHEESKTEGADQAAAFQKKLAAEHARTAAKTGYHASRMMVLLLRIWRLLDGSFLRSRLLQRKYIGKDKSQLGG